MLHIPLRLSPLAVALWLASTPGQAVELEPQVITANPLGNRQLATPTTVLEGDALLQQQQGSLGETLNKQPGVASTWFGPGASRPVIRGLDGDRIRILRNGVGALDASSLSYDHAVPLDPVNVERIEIVRGPAALLYGGNAIGGVVNTFDNRIPDAPIEGLHGAGELRYGGADTTRSSAGKLEAGNGAFALHLDANSRQFNDLRIPGYARSSKVRDADEPGSRHRLENSDGRQDGGAIGGATTGTTAIPACPTAAMTAITARLPNRAYAWTCSRTTTVSPPSCATWTARSARSSSMPATPTTSTARSKAARSTPPSRTKATKPASKPVTSRSGHSRG